MLKGVNTVFRVMGALTGLAIAFTAVTALAAEDNVTVMKFFTVTDKTLGNTYSESVEIHNISGADLAAGTLQIEFPSQIQLTSSNPGASVSGRVASILVPFLPAGGTTTVSLQVKAVGTGQFVISAASYFVNGTRVGFMSAPENINASASSLGTAEPTATISGMTAGASALPATGPSDMPAYFTAALLIMSWGAIRAKMSL